ncbi:MAG: hypothetical protein K2J92_01320 [Muribaculaceae bacterium]|nr:hypothetical protein [Bacteroides sp.]MDE6679973.1 hypothetical protein [Muribaculaceae bacterium]MDE6805097.1 hypothetical protein [Muribaculaceae bacterium]MDE6842899.1 hypothetical protein [Muribaculaceae bacterium]MDE7190823.1 hypothetical protein [Muribaculaceae bacterium]
MNKYEMVNRLVLDIDKFERGKDKLWRNVVKKIEVRVRLWHNGMGL